MVVLAAEYKPPLSTVLRSIEKDDSELGDRPPGHWPPSYLIPPQIKLFTASKLEMHIVGPFTVRLYAMLNIRRPRKSLY